MKILFIGGTGNISLEISKILAQSEHELVLLNRGQRTDAPAGNVRLIRCDIHDEAAVAELIADESFDVVADFIAYNAEHVERDFRLFNGKTKQYIFISSASAYQKPQISFPITESTPLANPFWQYARDKMAGEEFLMKMYRENGFPVTIVRPSHTYGDKMLPMPIAGWPTIKRMLAGKTVIIHGDGTSLWTLTHSRDVAKGFIGLLGNVHAIGDAVHITSDEVLNWNQIYKIYADALGVPLNAKHVSTDFLAACSPSDISGSMYGDMIHNVVLDNSKIKRLVPGFAATISFAEGIRRPLEYYLGTPSAQKDNPAFDKWCDLVIEAMDRSAAEIKAALAVQ